jgi:hypothetical protein
VGRRGSWVAWSMLAVFAISLVAALPLAVANGTVQQDAVNQVLLFLGFSAFMVVGALIVAHRSGNAIGWIFSTIALLAVTGQLASQYAIYAYVTRPGSLPAATLAAWYGLWPWFPITALTLIFTPLLFPTGRPQARPGALPALLQHRTLPHRPLDQRADPRSRPREGQAMAQEPLMRRHNSGTRQPRRRTRRPRTGPRTSATLR